MSRRICPPIALSQKFFTLLSYKKAGRRKQRLGAPPPNPVQGTFEKSSLKILKNFDRRGKFLPRLFCFGWLWFVPKSNAAL